MADQKITVQPSEGSPAAVAFKLLEKVMNDDDRSKFGKEVILDIYAECLQATFGYRTVKKSSSTDQ